MKDWLTVPLAAVSIPERHFIRRCAEETAQRFGAECAIVNIGIGHGATCYALRMGAPEAQIIGIDIEPDGEREPLSAFWRADSRRCHAQYQAAVHLLLIDGDHHYETVKADILGWTPKVASGGLVLFHDYNRAGCEWTVGVTRAVDELMRNENWTEAGRAETVLAMRRV